MGYFTLFKSSSNQQYYFNLKAGNHEIILQSQGYASKSGAENGIQSVKINSQYDLRYSRLRSTDWQYYFTVKASNGEIIGKSQMYGSTTAMETGIASVKSNAPSANIVES